MLYATNFSAYNKQKIFVLRGWTEWLQLCSHAVSACENTDQVDKKYSFYCCILNQHFAPVDMNWEALIAEMRTVHERME